MKLAEKKEKKEKKGHGAAILSVWALLAGSSFYKILAVLLLAGAGELALFCHRLYRAGGPLLLEAIVEESKVHFLFLGALGVVFFILSRTEALLGDAGRYTMLRLKLTQTALFAIRTVYNVCCLLLLFSFQVGLVLGMAWLYRYRAGAEESPQMLFLAFYRSEFLHCLLPMAETGKWVRNALLLLAFGMEAAGSVSGRRVQAVQGGLFALAVFSFVVPIGMSWPEAMSDIVYSVIIAAEVRQAVVLRKGLQQC